MSVIIGADAAGIRLKEVVKRIFGSRRFPSSGCDRRRARLCRCDFGFAKEVKQAEDNLGIVIDAYGAGPFMVATKIKGMVAAEVSDERSAYMTRGHNNSRMITMGAQIVGDQLAKKYRQRFCKR